MSVECTFVELEITGDDLLRAIWYSDGSGARGGVPLERLPENYEIVQIVFDGYRVRISAKIRRTKP